MSKLINEISNKYGLLTVIERAPNKYNRAYWKCKCDCGNEITVRGTDLRIGKVKSCGCSSIAGKNLVNEIGNRYGKLTIIEREYNYNNNDSRAYWKCKCDCGNEIVVAGTELRRGVYSCGCIKSIGEQTILEFLLKNNIIYKKEFSFNNLLGPNGGKLRFDFAIFDNNNNLQLLIEYQGKQHFQNNSGKFGELERNITDQSKYNYCQNNKINLEYITYKDNIEECLNKIFQKEKKQK